MIKKAWQVPISLQPPNGRGTAHWFERTRATNRQALAACGMAVTPGLAKIAAPGAPQCTHCAKALREEKSQ